MDAALAVAAEQLLWEDVPHRVRALYKVAKPIAVKLRQAVRGLYCDPGYGVVWWHPRDKQVWVSLGDGDEDTTHQRWANALRNVEGVTSVRTEAEYNPPDRDNWVRIKTAAPLGLVGTTWDGINKAMGGPTPLTNSIVGGLLTGAVGYGAGAALEHLFPERFVERGRLRKNLGLAGLGLGALPGLWKGQLNSQIDHGSFLRGMVTPDDAKLAAVQLDPHYERAIKAAAGDWTGGGALDVESVPVDAFNRAVWNDVRQGIPASRNPFGTRDPWGNNEQPIHTPQALGAATTGIMAGLGAEHGAEILTPRQVITGLASAGVGLATANLAGRALSALAGLTPEAQEQLQNVGVWAGVLHAVVPPLFGH